MKKSASRGSKRKSRYFLGGLTLRRTIGRLALEMTRLWLLRCRRFSRAVGVKKSEPATPPANTSAARQISSNPLCGIFDLSRLFLINT